MASAAPATERERGHAAFDAGYWLAHADGYLVERPGGRIGRVHEVRLDDGHAVSIAVRAGLLGRRLLVFTADDVASIVPRAKRLLLRSSAVPIATEPLSELRIDPFS